MLRARLATSAVVIPLLLALIIYGPYWLFAAVVGILAVLGVAEYAAMAFPTRTGERLLNVLLGTFLVAAIATPEPRAVPAALSATIIVGLIWTLLARRDFEDGLRDFGLSLVGVFYTGLLLPHFIWLRTLDAWQSGWPPRWPLPEGACWVIFVLAIAMAGDAGGYTVGHAIESLTRYRAYNHGEAVAIGMVAAAKIAGRLRLLDDDVVVRLVALLEKLGLPTEVAELPAKKIINALGIDKKVIGGRVNFVLPEKLGKVVIKDDVSLTLVKNVLNDMGAK